MISIANNDISISYILLPLFLYLATPAAVLLLMLLVLLPLLLKLLLLLLLLKQLLLLKLLLYCTADAVETTAAVSAAEATAILNC